jgi:hypothetical protein
MIIVVVIKSAGWIIQRLQREGIQFSGLLRDLFQRIDVVVEKPDLVL